MRGQSRRNNLKFSCMKKILIITGLKWKKTKHKKGKYKGYMSHFKKITENSNANLKLRYNPYLNRKINGKVNAKIEEHARKRI